MKLFLALVTFLPVALAAFGVTRSGSNYLVDTGAGLVTTINGNNGDITSLNYNGKQLQDGSKFTHLSSGLGSATVTSSLVNNNIVVITIRTSTITHYYIVRSGVNTLYIGTYITAQPSVGELRFLARLNWNSLPNGHPNAAIRGSSGAIEGSDVFMVNGQTRSKYFSSVPFIRDQVHGVTGSGVGAFIIVPGVGYETSSGGPFFRDINNQGGDQQELYWYMNSGHYNPEAWRTGFFGPYALAITNGNTPSPDLDVSFFETLGLQGYVPASQRGTVTGSYSGSLAGQPVVIGFKNSAAQYWIEGSSPGNGTFTRNMMKPGTYDVTLYQGELEAGSGRVTVNAGQTANINIVSNLSRPNVIWSIGTPDGTPRGFLNADKIETMHPSDSRMSNWGPITFTVGSSASSFPMAQFKSVNSPTTVRWNAASNQIGARTLRIRTTGSFAGGRPGVQVNNWSAGAQPVPRNLNSRGVTRGTWRGENQVYDFNIPNGVLVAGQNTIQLSVTSGSSGDRFLSPNFIYDSIELF